MLRPVVGLLMLEAVGKGLPEQAVLIVDAVAVAWIGQTRERVQKARGQATETAITQSGVDFGLENIAEIETQIQRRFGAHLIEIEVPKVVGQQPPDQKLHREIMNLLRIRAAHACFCGVHRMNDGLANRHRERQLQILQIRAVRALAERHLQVIGHSLLERVTGRTCSRTEFRRHEPASVIPNRGQFSEALGMPCWLGPRCSGIGLAGQNLKFLIRKGSHVTVPPDTRSAGTPGGLLALLMPAHATS